MSEILQVNTGNSLTELGFLHHLKFDDYQTPNDQPAWWDSWRSFVAREMEWGTYDSVTTLSISWDSGWDELFQTLPDLCKNAHTLHLYQDIHNRSQPLETVKLLQSKEYLEPVAVPHLGTLILEVDISDEDDPDETWKFERVRDDPERSLPDSIEARISTTYSLHSRIMGRNF